MLLSNFKHLHSVVCRNTEDVCQEGVADVGGTDGKFDDMITLRWQLSIGKIKHDYSKCGKWRKNSSLLRSSA